MKINNLTVIVFSYNEEKRIKRVLNNFKNKCELLVIDNFSTDKTLKIIENANIRVVQKSNKGHLDIDLIKDILEIVSTDWLFFIQCSEVVPNSLFPIINKLINTEVYRAIMLNRISYTGGTLTHNQSKNYKNIDGNIVYTRLFTKNYLKIDLSKIHQEFPIEIQNINDLAILSPDKLSSLIHFRDIDVETGENKHMKYSKFDAEQMYKNGKRGSYFRVIFRPFKSILYFLSIQNIYKFNYYNFLTIIQHFQYILLVEMRLLEKTKGKSIDNCIENNNLISNTIIDSNDFNI